MVILRGRLIANERYNFLCCMQYKRDPFPGSVFKSARFALLHFNIYIKRKLGTHTAAPQNEDGLIAQLRIRTKELKDP